MLQYLTVVYSPSFSCFFFILFFYFFLSLFYAICCYNEFLMLELQIDLLGLITIKIYINVNTKLTELFLWHYIERYSFFFSSFFIFCCVPFAEKYWANLFGNLLLNLFLSFFSFWLLLLLYFLVYFLFDLECSSVEMNFYGNIMWNFGRYFCQHILTFFFSGKIILDGILQNFEKQHNFYLENEHFYQIFLKLTLLIIFMNNHFLTEPSVIQARLKLL